MRQLLPNLERRTCPKFAKSSEEGIDLDSGEERGKSGDGTFLFFRIRVFYYLARATRHDRASFEQVRRKIDKNK